MHISICVQFQQFIILNYLIFSAIRAAIFIQKWYRQHQARQEMRKRCNWQIFQNLEYASEQDQSEVMNFDIMSGATVTKEMLYLQLYKFFSDLMKHMPQAVGSGNKATQCKVTCLAFPSCFIM